MRELARRLGISPSAISQIETGRARPSVATLYAIVTELGMSLDDLFKSGAEESTGKTAEEAAAGAAAAPAPSTESSPVVGEKAREAIVLATGVHWERLTATDEPDIDFLHVVYDVGGCSSPDDSLVRHQGREYGVMLSGELEVTVGFETHTLKPGDSISFDSTTPHRLRNAGVEPATGIWVVVGRRGSDARLTVSHRDEG